MTRLADRVRQLLSRLRGGTSSPAQDGRTRPPAARPFWGKMRRGYQDKMLRPASYEDKGGAA